jgi:hypothetical protein
MQSKCVQWAVDRHRTDISHRRYVNGHTSPKYTITKSGVVCCEEDKHTRASVTYRNMHFAAVYGVYESVFGAYNKRIRPVDRTLNVLLDLQLKGIEEVVRLFESRVLLLPCCVSIGFYRRNSAKPY